MKKVIKSDILLYPCPVLLVTSRYKNQDNVLAVSWSGIVCSHPEYVSISIKPSRFSHDIIKKSRCFTINIINEDILPAADFCGSFSGKNIDKFAECNFTKINGETINVPMIKECPINIECQVEQIINLGSHTMFIGKVLKKLIDSDIELEHLHSSINPVTYVRPNYYRVDSRMLGSYGETWQQKTRSP